MNFEYLNIFVTGGCGFIPSNFINIYFEKYKNIHIYNVDKMDYCSNENNIFEYIRNNNKYTFIKGNICDIDLIYNIFVKYNIDLVVHFAADTHVSISFEKPIQFITDNIIGTTSILEAAKKYNKLKKFIYISTDEVYGDIYDFDAVESCLPHPTNPYSVTKISAEYMSIVYMKSFNIPVVITRSNNVFGPNQYPDKVIPKFIKQLKNNDKITIEGSGYVIRNFLHTEDLVNALDHIIKYGVIGEIYNIGSEIGCSVLELATKIIKILKKDEKYDKWIIKINDRPYNDKHYLLNYDKLKKLGWKIKHTNFDEELKNLIDNYY
jgi:dTDP-glucose 4,6-dehydratase